MKNYAKLTCFVAVTVMIVFYWLAAESYFGFNSMPKSPEEAICCGLLGIMACFTLLILSQFDLE